MKRFFIDSLKSCGEVAELNEFDSHHLTVVLREEVGSEVEIVSGEKVYTAKIVETGKVTLVELISESGSFSESPLELFLLQGMAKGERMELVIQKAVELGAKKIYPVDCQRSVVKLAGSKAVAKVERWQKIATGAAKQSGRNVITEVMPVYNMKSVLEQLPEDTVIIMPYEDADSCVFGEPLKVALAGEAPKRVAIIIGPEGGLTETEVQLAKDKGAKIVTLGKRILRTETAAIATMAVVMYQWGDLNGE